MAVRISDHDVAQDLDDAHLIGFNANLEKTLIYPAELLISKNDLVRRYTLMFMGQEEGDMGFQYPLSNITSNPKGLNLNGAYLTLVLDDAFDGVQGDTFSSIVVLENFFDQKFEGKASHYRYNGTTAGYQFVRTHVQTVDTTLNRTLQITATNVWINAVYLYVPLSNIIN